MSRDAPSRDRDPEKTGERDDLKTISGFRVAILSTGTTGRKMLRRRSARSRYRRVRSRKTCATFECNGFSWSVPHSRIPHSFFGESQPDLEIGFPSRKSHRWARCSSPYDIIFCALSSPFTPRALDRSKAPV